MSPNKRQRERERQLHQKRVARQHRARVRRQRTIAIVVVGALVLTAAVIAVVLNFSGSEQAEPVEENLTDTPPADDETDGETDGADPGTPQELPSSDPQQFDQVPDPALAQDRTWQATINTSVGTIELELDGTAAPQAVANFVHLASEGYYDDTACHRLLPDSLLQCGDPTLRGDGSPGYSFGPIENAPDDDLYPAATVAMARVGNDGESMGSQFFLVFDDVTLPSDNAGGYTVFGTVTEGLDILSDVGAAGWGSEPERPAIDVIIENVEIQ